MKTVAVLLFIGIVLLAGCTTPPAVNNLSGNTSAGLVSANGSADAGIAMNSSRGLPDNLAKVLGTDPLNPDTDGDGVPDTVDKTPLQVDSWPPDSIGVSDFSIQDLLLENNIASAGNPVSDHVEIVLSNNGNQDISNFTVLYVITDQKTNQQQSTLFHLKDFVLGAGQTKSVHIDLQGGVVFQDKWVLNGVEVHYRANPNGLYYVSSNDLKVDVTVNSVGHQAQKAEQIKSAGTPEVVD